MSRPPPPPGIALAAVAFALFIIWSNSFIAIGYLLGSEQAAPSFDFVGLTVGRFVPAALMCGGYCLLFRRREALALLRGEWPRLLLCGALAVPCYNFALYYGQQSGVPAPVASLTTALVPLFVMLLAAALLGERLTGRRIAGFLVAAAGMGLIAFAKVDEVSTAYPLLVLITAMAPLSWSLYSVISKPLAGRGSPLVWTYMSVAVGGLLVAPLLPGRAWRQLVELDLAGWAALGYLVVPCTVLGFWVWTWLLRHLPATSVGFTVFLNPPLTASSKALLALAMPATFVFAIEPQEWVGGGLTLAGLAIAVLPVRHRRSVPV